MAWNLQTWKSWQSVAGVVVSVSTAITIATIPLWYERGDAQQYPVPRDEAEIRAALIERTLPFQAQYGTSVLPWTFTNSAVKYYPSETFYYKNQIGTVPWTFSRLVWRGPGNIGYVDFVAERIRGRKFNRYDTYSPFYDHEYYGIEWWLANINPAATSVGELPYISRGVDYLSTNILNQIAKPLSAMKYTVNGGSYVTDSYTNVRLKVWWELDYTEVPTNKVLATALSKAFDLLAAADTKAPLEVQDPEGFFEHLSANFHVSKHICSVIWSKNLEGVYTVNMWEEVDFITRPRFTPTYPNLFKNAYAIVGLDAPYVTPTGYQNYKHPISIPERTWQVAILLPDDDGKYYHRVFDYRGRLTMYARAEIEAAVFGDSGSFIIGYQMVNPSSDHIVCEWNFEHLTNRSQFWDP